MSLQSTDPIADLLTRIRNAALVGKNKIRVPSSKLKEVVAKELAKANYIESVKVESAKPRDILVVKIAKDGEAARFNELTRMSKPGRRMYVGVEEIPIGISCICNCNVCIGENPIVYYGYDRGRWITSFWCINCNGSF